MPEILYKNICRGVPRNSPEPAKEDISHHRHPVVCPYGGTPQAGRTDADMAMTGRTSQTGCVEKTNSSTNGCDPTQRFTIHKQPVLGVSDGIATTLRRMCIGTGWRPPAASQSEDGPPTHLATRILHFLCVCSIDIMYLTLPKKLKMGHLKSLWIQRSGQQV